MAIDDDLAAIVKGNFQDATRLGFEIKIHRLLKSLQRCLDAAQFGIGQNQEFAFFHSSLRVNIAGMHIRFRPPTLAILVACSLLLSACGNKGSLTLPPKSDATGAVKAAPDHNSQPSTSR